MIAYARLYQLGKVELAYAAPLARYAVSQTREGRVVGNPMNSRDVSSPYAQSKKGIVVERLDHFDTEENAWQEAVVQDTRLAPVPDVVAFRVDFRAWLARLPRRDRRVAKFLVLGHRTLDAARRFNVTESRIAQSRRELAGSWAVFRNENSSALAEQVTPGCSDATLKRRRDATPPVGGVQDLSDRQSAGFNSHAP
jgi:hypothetical protein